MDIYVVKPDGTKVNAAPIQFPDGSSVPQRGDFVFTTASGPLWCVTKTLWTKIGTTVTVYLVTTATTQTADSFIVGGI